MLGDTQSPRFWQGKAYWNLDGTFVANGATLTGLNGAQLVLEDQGTQTWSIGNPLAGGTSLVFLNKSTGVVVRQMSGAVTPGVHNTQSFGSSASRWLNMFTTELTIGSTTISHSSGPGSPEGVKTAGIGSTWIRTDGTAGPLKYEKRSGTGNTGWVAIW